MLRADQLRLVAMHPHSSQRRGVSHFVGIEGDSIK